ncbi:MAG: hypothetical protein ABH851_06445 [Methanobacteriota archaeon]
MVLKSRPKWPALNGQVHSDTHPLEVQGSFPNLLFDAAAVKKLTETHFSSVREEASKLTQDYPSLDGVLVIYPKSYGNPPSAVSQGEPAQEPVEGFYCYLVFDRNGFFTKKRPGSPNPLHHEDRERAEETLSHGLMGRPVNMTGYLFRDTLVEGDNGLIHDHRILNVPTLSDRYRVHNLIYVPVDSNEPVKQVLPQPK